MQLTILGSNGTYPTAGRPASGYLVTHDGTSLWMDAGPGTYAALAEQIDPTDLDAVLLSHRHPDHCADTFALFHARAFGAEAAPPLPVLVPDGLEERLCAFVEGSADRMRSVFDFRTLGEGDTVTVGSLEVSIAIANHPPPTLAPRVSGGGKTLTYTADTGPSSSLEAHASGSDLLLAEATLGDGPPEGNGVHMTGAEAGSMAAAAGVRRLMLTHIAPHVDHDRTVAAAEGEFSGPVGLAIPGARVTI